ncbi:hypothetical protein DYB36_011904 [Aphanomyces astaci]|uniref:Uncharacterized protein n=1 Tax=Aphanomyces astaci TaxID=112090 RepID=A0A396ZXL6_APHAT|nr:hypothetical protein DYB36_011904 [Aphanomyces astaci]
MELSTPYCSPTLFDNELQELRAFGIFDSVDILLEKTADGTRNETDVVITVKESRMLSLYAGVESSGAEGTANTKCTLTNPLGHAEKIELSAAHGQYGSDGQNFSYRRPKFLGRPWWFTASAANEVQVCSSISPSSIPEFIDQ